MTTPSLYEWAGGTAAFRRLIDAFYDRVEKDDRLGRLFPGGVSETHRAHVTAWWVEVFGGPSEYTERLGGYETMLAHHRGLEITGEQRLRFACLMSRAADDAELPADPSSALRSSDTSNGEPDWLFTTQPGRCCRSACTGPAMGVGGCPALPALTP